MAIDSGAQMIYVSGGRVVDAEWDALKFSGLYSYDIRTSRWKMYKCVANLTEAVGTNVTYPITSTSDAYASHPFIPPRWGQYRSLALK